ncbi:hypothetical protein SLE2022_400820 [Rubroshorea leprosula]
MKVKKITTYYNDNWGQDVRVCFLPMVKIPNSRERLEGTYVSHFFEMESKVKRQVLCAPARITFWTPAKAALQVTYSNDILSLDRYPCRWTYRERV